MPSDSKVGTTRGSAASAGSALRSARQISGLRISRRGCAGAGDASTAQPMTYSAGPVGGTLTGLSNADYSLERKAEIKMAKRLPPAYTFPPTGKTRRIRGMAMRILIADDHPIVRHGLKQMLASDPAATVVGEATNGDEALELARKVEWDMAIFDFSMPGRSGLDLPGDIKKEFPGKPVLILSMH